MKKIFSKAGQGILFRRLTQNDAESLGKFFDNLSDYTKQSFIPHELTKNYATFLCHRSLENALRFVLVDEKKEIKGYVVINFDIIENEAERYFDYGISLEPGKDSFFDLIITDKYQNTGLGSQAMLEIIELVKEEKVKTLILHGGVHENNNLAISFYERLGFKKVGGYHTDVYNVDMMLAIDEEYK